MADLIVYLIPAGVMGGLGLALSGALLVAAKKFYVYEDPNIDLVEEMLPGANCGGCGLSGCRKFAEAIVAGEEDLNCPVGADGMMEEIAVALGRHLERRSVERIVGHRVALVPLSEKVPYQIDGDFAGWLPVALSADDRELLVRLPG